MTDRTILAPPLSGRSLAYLALGVLLVVAVSLIGAWATSGAIADWYPTLRKPWFTPPNAAFPIVWPALYALMAFGFWRILRAETVDGRGQAIVAFCVQLALNLCWSLAFFGARSVVLGLVVIVALLAGIVWMIAAFWRVDRPAAYAQLPYLAWVGFATLLNAAIFRLNSPF